MVADRARGLPIYLLLLAPAGAVLFFSYNAGGYFPRDVALVVFVAAQALVLYAALAGNPFARLTWPAVVAISSLGLFALWTLASQLWSHAPARSLIEFDRALLYVLVFSTCVLAGGHARRLRFAVRVMAAAIVVVAASALITRLLPDVWHSPTQYQNNRLSWPLTYWNALGILTAFGLVLCFHLTSSRSEPRPIRVLGAAAIPVLATTLLFTFSRAPIYIAAFGVVVYMLVGRPRALLSGLLATALPTAIALKVAYDADLLATKKPATAAAVVQGHHVARVVVGCVIAAALARAALTLLDRRRSRTLPSFAPLRARQAAAGLAVAGAVVTLIVLAASGSFDRAYHSFAHHSDQPTRDFRGRLKTIGSPGRVDQYRAAIDGFRDQPLHGTGAGTWDQSWARYRQHPVPIVDAHSLYLESLSEMGVIGLALILTFVLSVLGAVAAKARGPNRAVYGAVFAACLIWAVHAGVDWDWEMPATTLPFLALGGLAMGSRSSRLAAVRAPSTDARLAIVLGCLACLVVPFAIQGSQPRRDDGILSFIERDCASAMPELSNSLSWVAQRSEVYQAMAYCDYDKDYPVAAYNAMREARRYDPHSWETSAGMAIANGEVYRDPRPMMREALRRNPLIDELRKWTPKVEAAKKEDWAQVLDDFRSDLLASGWLTVTNA